MAADRIVLNGATIVDTGDGKLLAGMSLVIDGGKIGRISADGVPDNQSAQIIDARGTYVVPGFLDLHAHPLSSSDPKGSLTLLLANGVTGFREMAASDAMLAARRQGTLMPASDAPELLELGSEPLSAMNAATPDAAVAFVRKQKAEGADFIKVLDYSPDVLDAVAAECKRSHMRFMGHLPPSVDVREAAKACMTSIEHLGPRDSVLLGASIEEENLRPAPARVAPPASQSGAPPAAAAATIARALANPMLSTSRDEIARYQRVIDTFSEEKCRDLAAQFVAAGTWLVPTLIRVRTMSVADDPRYRTDPNLQYVPKQTRDLWKQLSDQFSTKFPPASRETLVRLFVSLQKLVKPFKKAGVPMMAGSDMSGGFIVPGFGLHQEFDLLEEAGLSGLDVLQMTTLDGAKFLGRESTMGSVAEGKNADLVLLGANPIESVANLHSVVGVVRAGRYYGADALAAIKRETAARMSDGAAGVPAPPSCC